MDESSYGNYDSNVFVSKPFAKIYFNNGLGFYILNSYKFRFFPKFYFNLFTKHLEIGFYFLGFIFEIMWNKAFVVKK